jgi:flavin reductase (DIM6/NTAB) family NADH-FMN oxidoreductase RutF
MNTPVSLDEFRETLSSVPMPVTIVTASSGGVAFATTVSSFCSLSAEPPMILVALDRGSDTLPVIEASGQFGVNVLAAHQEDVARGCARKGTAKVDLTALLQEGELPRLADVAAWLRCDLHEMLPGGDHLILTGLVTECQTTEHDPLIYRRRAFHRSVANGTAT